ncbi:hypothetical protein L3Q82_001388 [Scortum barcoo]|uniref:Uncharacterized protein n=1 Tax=Scortum barcoo TaxID=214431 RepID=A0ACB8W817_9TELE|nr:hypothetical protein L3Q82_001388 [Scortum barcoo]
MSSQPNGGEAVPPARTNQRTFLDDLILTFTSPMAWLLVVALIITWAGVAIVLFDLLDYKTLAGLPPPPAIAKRGGIRPMRSSPARVPGAVTAQESTDWLEMLWAFAASLVAPEDDEEEGIHQLTETLTCEVMSRLLMEIRQLDRDAASVLEKAGFGTDSDIQSLTREDLHDLFPGCVKLKLRRAIFEKAQKHKPIDVLLRELKSFIPDEHLRAASTGNGVLADYLNILKDMKTQMNKIQSFLDAHIDLLQGFNRDHPVQGPDTARCLPDTDAVGTSGQIGHNTGPADGRAQGHTRVDSLKQRDLLQVTVKYKKVVTGKTFKANEQLMGMVMANFNDRVEFIESEDDAHTIIVFCPITSRIGSDVDAAMSNVRVVLVMVQIGLKTWRKALPCLHQVTVRDMQAASILYGKDDDDADDDEGEGGGEGVVGLGSRTEAAPTGSTDKNAKRRTRREKRKLMKKKQKSADTSDNLMSELPFCLTSPTTWKELGFPSPDTTQKKRKRKRGDSGGRVDSEEDADKKKKKKESQRPNYFVSIPITNTQISSAVLEVQEAVLQQEPRLAKAMIPVPTLHITLLVTHLANQEQVDLAATLLAQVEPSLAELLGGRDLVLPFSGISHFRKEVVFVGLAPGQHRHTLDSLAELLQSRFLEQGLLAGDSRGFEPHLTIMKLSRASKLRSQGIKRVDPALYSNYTNKVPLRFSVVLLVVRSDLAQNPLHAKRPSGRHRSEPDEAELLRVSRRLVEDAVNRALQQYKQETLQNGSGPNATAVQPPPNTEETATKRDTTANSTTDSRK